MPAPRYIDAALSKSYQEVRKDAILEDADNAIRSLQTSEGRSGKCTSVFLKFPFQPGTANSWLPR